MTPWFVNPPVTNTTLGTSTRLVDFAMRDAYMELRPGNSSTASGLNVSGAVAVHVVVNSSSTPATSAGTNMGTVTITFSDNTQTTTPLVVASNVREWEIGNAPAAVCTLTDPAASNAWTGLSSAGRQAVLDMDMISLAGKTAQPVSVTVTNTSNFGLDWFGLTIEKAVPTTVLPPAGGGTGGKHEDKHESKKHDHKSDSAKPDDKDDLEHEDD
jgi:hypothetical protein